MFEIKSLQGFYKGTLGNNTPNLRRMEYLHLI